MTAKILVLDDDTWNVGWIARYASLYKAQTKVVGTIEEALAVCKAEMPDLAIVDVMIGDPGLPLEGRTLGDIPSDWHGLKFVGLLRTDPALKKAKPQIIVYSYLNSEFLTTTVNSLEAEHIPKSEGGRLRHRIRQLCGG